MSKPDPHDLSALLTALEAATEGSRELDERIALYVGWAVQPDGRTQAGIPAYSTILDAALTLVPDGMWWLLGKGQTRPDEPLYGAQIMPLHSEPDAAPHSMGEAHTPALAMCCAALRSKIYN